MTFSDWWSEYWRMIGLPDSPMNIAFKEIAENAWNAATEQAERARQEGIEAKFHLTNAEFHD